MLVRGAFGSILLLLWIWAVLDVIATDSVVVRNLPKGTWIMLVVFVPTVGAVAWLLLGRPEYASMSLGGNYRQPPRDPDRYRPRAPAARGPDDDPDFIMKATGAAGRTEESFAIRERKLLEREAELAKREAEQVASSAATEGPGLGTAADGEEAVDGSDGEN